MLTEITTGILIVVGSTVLLGIFGILVRLHTNVKKIVVNEQKQKEAITLLIGGHLGLLDAVRTGKTNGNLSKHEDKLKAYLAKEAVG